jgi:hypothetical protein
MSARHALRSFLCGLGGHELMRSFERDRLYMRCISCPYETPGWTLKDKAHQHPAPRALGAALTAHSAR